MKTIKGPALFLAQFAGDEAPFNSWAEITNGQPIADIAACRCPAGTAG
jgi:hypothetical protein